MAIIQAASYQERWLGMNRNLWIIQPTQLRDMWLDYAEMQEIEENLLEEHDEFGYDKCIIRGTLAFNKLPPTYPVSPAYFPSEALLLDLAFCEVLKVAERYHANNLLTSSSGGIQTTINDRFAPLGQIRRELEGTNNEAIRQWKIFINNEEGWARFDDADARHTYGL